KVAGIVPCAGDPVLPDHERLDGAVELPHREGSFEKHDRVMLGGLLNLRDLTVADVMIHRTEVITADVGEPPERVVEAVLQEPVTRVPVWRRTPHNNVGDPPTKRQLPGLPNDGSDVHQRDITADAHLSTCH